jgi:hypothetical protein
VIPPRQKRLFGTHRYGGYEIVTYKIGRSYGYRVYARAVRTPIHGGGFPSRKAAIVSAITRHLVPSPPPRRRVRCAR